MPPRRKLQVPRPGFNKYGFKIKKPETTSLAQSRKNLSESSNSNAPSIAARREAQVETQTPKAKARSAAKVTRAGGHSWVLILQEASSITDNVTVTTEPAVRPSSETPDLPADDDESLSVICLGSSPQRTSVAIRSHTSMTAPEDTSRTPFDYTPAYVRQLREAARFPDKSTRQTEPMNLGTNHQSSLPSDAASTVSRRADDSALALFSTTPKLVSSSGDYDEYTISTTYRVPRNSTIDPAKISVVLPTCKTMTTHSDLVLVLPDDRRSIRTLGELHKPGGPKTSVATNNPRNLNTAAATDARQVGVVHNREKARSSLSKGRRPTPHHAGSPFHRLTPKRSITPVRRKTPARRSTPVVNRSRKTPLRGTTPMRKGNWKKTMSNMAEYQLRCAFYPRRSVFDLPLRESITITRLETFWKILCDLIANKKLFARAMWEHWEHINACVRMINQKLAAEEAFKMQEGCAAARELMRQRKIMFVGGGKVMLTRNATGTRLS